MPVPGIFSIEKGDQHPLCQDETGRGAPNKMVKRNRGIARAGLIVFLSVILVTALRTSCVRGEEDLTELNLEQLMDIEVYGASKFKQKVKEAPSSVSIVTSDDIRKFGHRTLADILRSVRSFQIYYPRDYSYGGARGFGRAGEFTNRILVLVNGHRTNENIYDAAYLGNEFLLDVDLIDRVEIIRGPGSSLYGNNAFSAVVNVITRQGKDLQGSEISGETGSFGTYKGRATYGNKFQNGMEFLTSVTDFTSKGDNLYFREFDSRYSDDPRATPTGVARHGDYEHYQSLFSAFSYLGFSFEGAYASRTKGVPTAAYGTDFNRPRTEYFDSHGYVDVKYDRSIGEETDIAVRLFWDDYRYKGDYFGNAIWGTLNKSRAHGEWWGSEARLSSQVFKALHLTVGAEYIDHMHKDHKNYDVDPYYVYDDNKRHSTVWALYLQSELRLTRELILSAGARYDHYSTFGSTTNPRLGLIYNPTERSTFKLLYGTAFRAPSEYEMYYFDVAPGTSNQLKSEKIKTYELVYEQSFGDHFRMTADAYYYTISGIIESVPADSDSNLVTYRNNEDIKARGFELELEKVWDNGLKAQMSYTIQSTEDGVSGRRLTNSPQHMMKFNLLAPIFSKKAFLGIEEQYTSKRKTLAGDYAGGFFITNLTLFCENIVKGLDISLSAYNLFDRKYSDPGLEGPNPDYLVVDKIEQNGRTFRLKFTYKF